jgi:hypothetical protein
LQHNKTSLGYPDSRTIASIIEEVFMRTFTAAFIAAFLAAGTVAAYAQSAAPAKAAPAKSKCKGLAEADCKANTSCTWTAGTGSAAGKCTKTKKPASK